MKKISELGSSLKKIVPEESPKSQENITVEEKDVEEGLKDLSKAIAKTKQEEWVEDLKEFGMNVVEATSILDSIITLGYYEESYRYGKTIFKLRTRTAADSDRLVEMIQEFDPKTPGVLSHLIARINLASSLHAYGDNVFSFSYPADNNRSVLDSEFNERYSFISRLPQATFFALSQVLERFDKRVNLASDPRSLENF